MVTGPRGLPLLGDVVGLARDPLGFVAGLARDHGRFARFRIGPYRHVLVGELDGIHHVLVDQHRKYVKGRGYDGVRLVFRSGLLVSEGETWRERRRLIQPQFLRGRFERYAAAVADAIDAMHDRWVRRGDGWLDLHAEMVSLTLDVVGRTLLGRPLAEQAMRVGHALTVLGRFGNDYGNAVVRAPLSWPLPSHERFRSALATLDDVVARLPRDGADDLVAALEHARASGRLPEDGVRDELVTTLAAGHETTATALVFAFASLAAAPEWAARVRAEADAVGGRASYEAFPTSAAVFHESLRLWPPVWFLERLAIEDDEVSGVPIPRGDTVAIAPWTVQRDPDLWPDPDRFDPTRFLDGLPTGERRLSFLAFGAGPRTCIGAQLATLEGQLAIAGTLRRFDLKLGPEGPPRPVAELMLRPAPGFRVWLSRRSA